VKVTDFLGKPVEKAAVTVQVTRGEGTVASGSATTDKEGMATLGNWTLGSKPGLNTLVASVEKGVAVTFLAVAAP
jgi:hypothetical protein